MAKRKREITDEKVRRSLGRDFFESHERYTEFFRLLNDPTMFRRYKALVIDRAEFTDTSCHEPRDAVFPMAG